MRPLEFEVPSDYDGQRLDRFLVSVLADFSRSQIQKLIADGHVTLSPPRRGPVQGEEDGRRRPPARQGAGTAPASEGDAGAARAFGDAGGDAPSARQRVVKANAMIREGTVVTVDVPAPVESDVRAEPIPIEILFQDADLAVLNKPAGMVVHPAAGHDSGTLVNALLHHMDDLSGIGGERRPGIVHRLDRGTSGVMVVAKNDAAHHELARQFHDREVEKEYIALVWGVVQAGRRIDAAIGRDRANRQKMSSRAKHAREAVTRITRAHQMPGLTLCQVAIHTGRTHQIRVHLSAIGHPIVGDALYGGVHRRVAGDIRAVQRLQRPFLHAARLVFKHPRDERRMEFIAPLAPDLQQVLEDLPGWPP